ncbi:MAG: isochorismatase family protein [Betaproteobacteria bacterium]|nr:isochorismatase family protein [Betaproteobacteria bacterium]
MLLERDEAQLVLVDYQQRLMPAIHGQADVLAQAVRLGRAAQLLGVPVWGTEQNPQKLGDSVPQVKALLGSTLAKMHFNACDAGLAEALRPPAAAPQGAPQGASARSLPKRFRQAEPAPERNSVVLAGCEAHVCVLQTALGLLQADFDVWVVTDACGSRTERNRDAAFDRLAAAGAELVTTEMVLFEWLQSAEHPRFKDVMALIK